MVLVVLDYSYYWRNNVALFATFVEAKLTSLYRELCFIINRGRYHSVFKCQSNLMHLKKHTFEIWFKVLVHSHFQVGGGSVTLLWQRPFITQTNSFKMNDSENAERFWGK